ncbi:hypothetical protein GWK47_019930 [Chionoecetes opilio]|uniref:Uncharacterized protein n=1 Tax=Chionoecetes opilio TaxID=41210 RepID=A0A8J4XQA0_CHIOP|nr:hypothetical protein GWK47_019930 [Chionoecetes opilio]
MVWGDPFDHASDCYFCATQYNGINRKNRHSLQYPDLPSARRPLAHCEEIPVPSVTELPDSDDEATSTDERDIQKRVLKHKIVRSPFHNVSLMIWFGISDCRRLPRAVASRLKRKIYLARTRVSFSFRRRHEAYMGYFCQEEDLVYCRDFPPVLLVKTPRLLIRSERLATLH